MSHLALLDYLQICKNVQNRWTILQTCWREGKKVKRFGETRRIKRIVRVYPQLFEESRYVNHSGKIRAANRLFDAVTEIGPPMEMDYWSDYLSDWKTRPAVRFADRTGYIELYSRILVVASIEHKGFWEKETWRRKNTFLKENS